MTKTPSRELCFSKSRSSVDCAILDLLMVGCFWSIFFFANHNRHLAKAAGNSYSPYPVLCQNSALLK